MRGPEFLYLIFVVLVFIGLVLGVMQLADWLDSRRTRQLQSRRPDH
jgi:hypothetical protein